MFRHLFNRVIDRYVALDVVRLVQSYGSDAIYMARHASIVAGGDRRCHWKRVLAEIELKSKRRDW